jgi:hypothetical protein
LDKIRRQLVREKRFILAHGFRAKISISVCGYLALLFLGPCMVRQNIMAESMWQSKVIHLMVGGRQREQQEGARDKI